MTFKDRLLNSMTFQAWKMKCLNSMTFQVFRDLYESCAKNNLGKFTYLSQSPKIPSLSCYSLLIQLMEMR